MLWLRDRDFDITCIRLSPYDVQRGVSPERMMEAVPGYKTSLFVSASGDLGGEEFLDAARAECQRLGRAFDPRRFASRDDELIHFDGRTYSVTNQIGSNTEVVLSQLTDAFAFPDVRWQRTQIA